MTSLLAPRSSTGPTNFLTPRDPPTSSSWSNCCPRNLLPLYLFSLGLKIWRFSFRTVPPQPWGRGAEAGTRTSDTSRRRWRARPESLTCPGAGSGERGAGGGRGAAWLSQRSRNPGPRNCWGRPNPSGPDQARPVPTPVPPSSSLCLQAAPQREKFQVSFKALL